MISNSTIAGNISNSGRLVAGTAAINIVQNRTVAGSIVDTGFISGNIIIESGSVIKAPGTALAITGSTFLGESSISAPSPAPPALS